MQQAHNRTRGEHFFEVIIFDKRGELTNQPSISKKKIMSWPMTKDNLFPLCYKDASDGKVHIRLYDKYHCEDD